MDLYSVRGFVVVSESNFKPQEANPRVTCKLLTSHDSFMNKHFRGSTVLQCLFVNTCTQSSASKREYFVMIAINIINILCRVNIM